MPIIICRRNLAPVYNSKLGKEVNFLNHLLLIPSEIRWGRIRQILLICCWICGLLLGIHYASQADDTYFLLMHTACASRVSITGLLAAVFLPFLFSAFAVYISHPELLLAICFLKAASFSCSSYGLMLVFENAGWLVRLLFQFSDYCMMPILLWFSARHIARQEKLLWQDLLICGLWMLIVGALDYCIVSPFLVGLIDH